MSLIGIDIGTSAIKVAGYRPDGQCLATVRVPVGSVRAAEGRWEVDPSESVRAFTLALRAVLDSPAVGADPPVAVSFSSSGREVFPAADDGSPLGPCVMAADHRGDDIAERTAGLHPDSQWFASTGHLPGRMDPANRIRWWQQQHPDVAGAARWFLNWHELYALLLTGRPVTDRSSAATWAVYDLDALTWSADRTAELGLHPGWLPEVQASGTPIGTVTPQAAARFGLPSDVLVVTGAWDLVAASVGQGALRPGVLGLTAGTWHSFCLPAAPPWSPTLLEEGASVFPLPGPAGFALGVFDPNGMSVVDWALRTVGLSWSQLTTQLADRSDAPSPVRATAGMSHLSHRATPGASLAGLRLSTAPIDLVQALLESISAEFAGSVRRLTARGHHVDLIRAAGGGSTLPWLMQLHADLTGIPVEVVAEDEPGAHGAAILAGTGAGTYPSPEDAGDELVRTRARFEPREARRRRYTETIGPEGRNPS